MLEKSFSRLYRKFKLQLYARVLGGSQDQENVALNPQEVLSMEIIVALHRPTVAEFAKFAKLSAPNAAYRVNRLVDKGFLVRKQSTKDKREFHLKPTKRYREMYGSLFDYIGTVSDRVRERFPEEDVEKLDEMLSVIVDELMPEAQISMRRVHIVEEEEKKAKENRMTTLEY